MTFPQPKNNDYDFYGYLGSYFIGATSTFWLVKPIQQTQYEKVCWKIGLGLTALYFTLTIILFYTVKN